MALTKEEIYSGGVRYYGDVTTITEVAGVYTADEVASLTSLCIRDSKLTTIAGVGVFKSLEELNLGNNKLTEAPELETLSNLKDLDLSENKLTTVVGLADLPIEKLDLSTNPIASLANFDAPATLVGLKMHSCQLSSLKGLGRFTALDSLGIHENNLTSIDAGPVPSLRSLTMKSNPMQRSAGLEAFPGLTHLVLGDDIRVLEGLEHLPNLKKIEVTGPLEEITPASLEVLVAMKLGDGKVSLYGSDDLFDRYPSLKIPPKQDPSRGYLKYRGEPLTIRGLASLYTPEECKGIKTMTLSACSISDTDGLEAFPSLTILDLGKNKVKSVVGISGMANLDTLTLEDNAITSVADIEANASVDEMSLQKNLLVSMEGLSGFTKLRKLDATRNPTLKNAHPGQPLPALEHLDLSATGLETIQGLAEAFPNLRHLDIDRTEVTHIEGLDGFEHLSHVVMSDKVETIDEGSLAKIVAMRAKGERARFGWSDPASLVAKYPALAGE